MKYKIFFKWSALCALLLGVTFARDVVEGSIETGLVKLPIIIFVIAALSCAIVLPIYYSILEHKKIKSVGVRRLIFLFVPLALYLPNWYSWAVFAMQNRSLKLVTVLAVASIEYLLIILFVKIILWVKAGFDSDSGRAKD